MITLCCLVAEGDATNARWATLLGEQLGLDEIELREAALVAHDDAGRFHVRPLREHADNADQAHWQAIWLPLTEMLLLARAEDVTTTEATALIAHGVKATFVDAVRRALVPGSAAAFLMVGEPLVRQIETASADGRWRLLQCPLGDDDAQELRSFLLGRAETSPSASFL